MPLHRHKVKTLTTLPVSYKIYTSPVEMISRCPYEILRLWDWSSKDGTGEMTLRCKCVCGS